MGGMITKKIGAKVPKRISLTIIFVFFISIFIFKGLSEATQAGPNNPTTASGTNWTTATNVYTSNNAYAVFNNTTQNDLIIKGFGFALPSTATITGITVIVEGNGSSAVFAQRQYRIGLTKDGTTLAGTRKVNVQMDSSDSDTINGNAGDLWGTTWTYTDINSANFGILISDNDVTAGALNIDWVRVIIDYNVLAGDGYLLKRKAVSSDDELCHVCHLTDQNTWSTNPNSIKSHNSTNTGSSKWSSSGGWGITGGKYGKFTCATCHSGHNTNNIYILKKVIQTSNGTNWGSTNSQWVTVDFRAKTGTAGVTPGTMGDDTNTHATSARVCEVCHSQTNYHKYNQTTVGHNNAVDCSSCHSHKGAFGGGGSCDGCHGAPPGSGTDNNAPAQYAASHAQHYSTVGGLPASYTDTSNNSTPAAYVIGCARCHNAQGTNTHNTSQVSPPPISVLVTLNAGEWFTRGTNWMTNAGPPGTKIYYNFDSKCSSVYCHGNFTGGTASNVPVWGSSSTGACGTCHGASIAAWPAGGSHQTHISTIGGVMLSCNKCHKDTVAVGFTTVSRKDLHVNERVDWNLDATDSRISTIGQYKGVVAGTAGWGTTGGPYGLCSSIYCHSNGMAAPTYASPTWGSAPTGACGTCHGANNINPPASTLHAQHVGTIAQYEFACSKCHSTVVYAAPDSTVWATISSTSLHVNQVRDVAFDAYNTGGTFVGGKCNALYCHSDGTSIGNPSAALISTVGWSGTLDCGGCHGKGNTPAGWPTYTSGTKKNSHAAHPTDCTLCHSATVSSTSTISNAANHTNKLYNVVQKATINTFSYAFSTVGGTCTAVSCHGGGSGTWGGGSLACDTCHAASNILAGKHSQHYEWGSVATTPAKSAWNSTTNTAYIFSCGVCHDSTATTHAGGDWTTFAAAEVDFDATIALGGSYRPHTTVAGTDQGNRKWTPGWQSNACASTYCHSQGRTVTAPFGGAPNTNTFQWVTSSTLTCAGCHSTTAWNTSPHMTHANTWATSYSYDCTRCHNATALSGINTIANKTKHVNKVKDIAFDTWNPQGTIINNTCQQTYCHSSGTGWTSNLGDNTRPLAWRTVSWTDTVNCGTCHGSDATGRPTYASYTTKANSHVAHGAYTCDACHFATTSNGTTITSVGRHVNRIYDLQWKTSVGSYGTFTYAYSTGGGTCSTIQCHNGTNAVWGSSGSASMDCIGCHSTAKAKAKYGTGTIGNYGSLTNRSGWTTMIRQVAGNGGDFAYPTFTRASRHLMGISTIGQITKWDCIVCHREGTSGGSSDATNHKDGMVHLRNVDTINNAVGYTVDNRLWNTIDYTNLDTFCLTCHDANGASAFTVNATNNGIDSTGARALTPFNTNDTAAGYISGSTWNTTARRALKVTNVKDQFFAGNGGSQGLVGGSAPSWTTGGVYNGNPSQHAVIGYRYNTIWTSWAATAWSTSTTLKKMNQTMRTAREVSLLSCADCHVLDAGGGAHGGRSAYNLWTSGSVAAWNTGYTQDMLCWKCHTRAVYTATGTPVAGSRVDHSANSDCGNVTSADSNGYGFGAMDKPCFVCHAGWNGSTTVTKQASYGGIHGSWSSTAWYTTGAAKTTAYRFFPGAWYRINRPSDAAWNSVSASPNCYFWPNAATGFASCNSHAGSSGSRGGTTDYNRPVKY